MQAPTERQDKRISWGALFWALPLGYVLFDPWRSHAGWLEWVVTLCALAAVLALYLTGVTWITRPQIAGSIAVAVFIIAIAFLAFRPGGAIFFPVAAAFAPFAVRGRLLLSTALVVAVAVVFGLAWWRFYPERVSFADILPWAIAAETVLVGAGTTYGARQNKVVERLHRATERERIARDLHDLLGHSLSSIALKAELATRILRQDPQRALLEIGEVESISRRALEEVQQAIRGYHSCDIQMELERAGSMLEVAGVSVRSRCELAEIDPGAERILGLVLREAVTNVVRHAHATMCRLLLAKQADAYRLEVHDNGRGGTPSEGIGMRSIRARVEAAGGSVSWQAVDGMLLTVTLPTSSPAERA